LLHFHEVEYAKIMQGLFIFPGGDWEAGEVGSGATHLRSRLLR
jgi:hypothetical protein